jgi:hypothetical protein
MALVACRECEGEVSSRAESCPRCGVAFPCGTRNKKRLQTEAARNAIGAVLMGLGGVLIFCGIPNYPPALVPIVVGLLAVLGGYVLLPRIR